MSALTQQDIPKDSSDSARLSLTALSWWLDPRVMSLVKATADRLALSLAQSPRLFNESWFPNTLGVSRESSDRDRLLAAGMFSDRDADPESIAFLFADSDSDQRLTAGMFH